MRVSMAAVSFVFLLTSFAAAAPGDLDPTFGAGGMRVLPPSVARAQAVAVAPDGAIVTAGYHGAPSPFQWVVARLLDDGSLDTSFGAGGLVTLPFALGGQAQAVSVLPDRRIVVAGVTATNEDWRNVVTIVRLLPDGTLDASFGAGGIALTIVPDMTGPSVRAMATYADGRLIVGGAALAGDDRSDGYDWFLVRYDTAGGLDASFGDDGIVSAAIGPYDDLMAGLRLDGSERIVVGGSSGIDIINDGNPAHFVFSLARFLADGALDATFGSGGKVLTDVRPTGSARMDGVVLQDDDAVVAVGEAWQVTAPGTGIAVARYTAGGVLAGITESHPTFGFRLNAVGRDAAGRVLVTGIRFNDGTLDSGNVMLLRFGTDDRLDGGFGVGGVAQTDVAGFVDEGLALTTDASGRILVAGSTYDGGDLVQMAVFRHAGGICADGAVCDDGDPCTVGETCSDGACAGPAAPNGTACDDRSVCTDGETCNAGTCGGGTTTTCDDCFACDAIVGCIPEIEPVCAETADAQLRVGRFPGAPLSWRWRGEGPDAARGMKLCVFLAPSFGDDLGWVEGGFRTGAEGVCTPEGCWRGGRRGLRYS